MLRTIIVLLFVVIFLILSIIAWLILDIVGLFSKKTKDRIGYKIVSTAFSIVWHLSGTKPIIQGMENIPSDTSVLFVGNHQSIFDVVVAYSICPPVTGFLSKKEFEKVPLLSVWMHKLYCLFLTRTDPRQDLKLITYAQELVKEGINIFVFPEGTRTKTGEMAEFHEAALRISTKTGHPIVPVAITNTRSIFEDHFPFIRKQKIVITFLPPVYPTSLEGDDKKYIGAYTRKLIQAQLDNDKYLI